MKVEQVDFNEEGNHQWTLNHKDYRVVIARTGEAVEITIKAMITGDPDLQDWKTALATVNTFYEELRIANKRTPEPNGHKSTDSSTTKNAQSED